MRRHVSLVAALTLIGAGCGGPKADRAMTCRLGPSPAGGEITYAQGGRLLGVTPDGGRECLAQLPTAAAVAQWAPAGDRVLLDNTQALLAHGSHPTGFAHGDQLAWSPVGKSLLAVTPTGDLLREPAEGGKPQDLTFLNRHEATIYHPSGRAIVSVGWGNEGYGIYLADTTGKLQATLAEGHTARHIGPLAWTNNADLVFAAQHDDRWDLHRLELGGAGQLTTLASTPGPNQPITDLAASPFSDGGVAWRQGDCANATLATKVLQAGHLLSIPPEVATATPTGWLPDGTLILQRSPCHDTHRAGSASVIYAFKDSHATPMRSVPGQATVRVALPPGPELPSSIASAGPI